MTTVELAKRLLAVTQVNDPGNMPMDGWVDVADACNAALQEFFAEAPTLYKRTTASHLVPAPTTGTINIARGSTAASSGTPFTDAQRGATVRIGDDPRWNEVVSSTQVLDAYRGTGGSAEMTVYGDAIPFLDMAVTRVLTDPLVIDTGKRLVRDDKLSSYANLAIDGRHSREIGSEPTRYAVDYVGQVRAELDEPLVILRLDPLPSMELTVRVDVELGPSRYTIRQMTSSPVNLPVAPHYCESMLVPLAEEKMLSSRWLKVRRDQQQAIGQRYARALQAVRHLPPSAAKPNKKIRTPSGW